MRSKHYIATVVALIFFSLISVNRCLSSTIEDGFDKDIVNANTRFGIKLFNDLIGLDPGKNVFISPSSISTALTMVYIGSAGVTRNEMAATLTLQEISLTRINTANSSLKRLLEEPGADVRLSIANSIWMPVEVVINPKYKQMVKQYYQAEVTNLDFNDSASPSVINNWVKENTEGKISKIVDSINSSCLLILINAIYFKGNWAMAFDKSLTTDRPFSLINGRRKQCPMMSQSGSYRYLRGRDFQAVSLPYGKGKVSMYVFLPDQETTLEAFFNNLTYENWQRWMGMFSEMEGDIILPRFKIDYEITLNETLQNLGMPTAFNPNRADFKRIFKFPQPVYISKVKHKTFVEVNEEGTEAAAVTFAGMELGAIEAPPPPERFSMVVDRPFFCAIRDNKTGTVLFMGAIVEPE